MTGVSEPRRAWLDAGRAEFLSAPVLLAFLVWALASTIYFEVIATGDALLPRLSASLLSSLVVLMLLTLVARHSRNRWPDGPGPWRALGIYLAAGALRGLLLGVNAAVLGLTSPIELLPRIGYSAAWSVAVMGCMSVVAARRAAHRRLMKGLERRQHELLTLQSTLGERIEQTHRDLVRQVQEELGPTLTQLRSDLDIFTHSTNAPVDDVVDRFRTAVANVVRPLSRTLAEPQDDQAVTLSASPLPWRARNVERIPVARTIAPVTSAIVVLVLLALLALGVAPGLYRPDDVPVRVTIFVVSLWLGLMAVRWLVSRVQLRATLPTFIVTLSATYVALAVLVGNVTRLVIPDQVPASMTFPALAATLAALAPLAVSVAIAFQTLARNAELERAETVAELEGLTAVLRRELWRERRRLALTVHGPIQSALVAAAVTMSRPGFTAEDVPGLVDTLDQAMAHINRTAGPQPAIDAASRDLVALWTDSAAVTITMTPNVAATIDLDEALRAVVIEVLREGVSNAIRHGAADTITADVNRPARGILRLSIEDDGDGPPLAATPGLGSAMLDEVALTWSLRRTDAITRLDVDLALSEEYETAER